jgi:serine protease AprX
MKKSMILISVCFFGLIQAFAQQKFIVTFKDKGDVSTYNVEKLLSKKTLNNRASLSIGVDQYDYPVNKEFLKDLQDNNVRVLSTSKWLNAALVISSLNIQQLYMMFPEIKEITVVSSYSKTGKNKFLMNKIMYPAKYGNTSTPSSKPLIDYGAATQQNLVFEIDFLHDKGFLGDGITIAFLDAGYDVMDTISYFDSTFLNNRIIDTYDFWDNSTFVYHKMGHGTACASEIIANKPGHFVGMAPNVNLMFYITDDEYTETHQDEYNYVRGLERADSIGVDIVSASVSYMVFDPGQTSYTYADMNGHTAISTIGCNIAAAKGIIIANAAGNGGKITAPSDAFGILGAGGAYMTKVYDGISSTGPSFDGRIKPDVAGVSMDTYCIYIDGNIWGGNGYGGTSGATPFIAGLAACLKQAFPKATSVEIINAIKQSGNHAANPDTLTGYGVPNARIADSILNLTYGVSEILSQQCLTIYPNPSQKYISIKCKDRISDLEIYTTTGQLIMRKEINNKTTMLDITNIPGGIYFVKVFSYNGCFTGKLIKQ